MTRAGVLERTNGADRLCQQQKTSIASWWVRAWSTCSRGRCRWTWRSVRGNLFETEPLLLTTGGIVSNAGITLARLGMRVAAFTYVGDDEWADVIRRRFAAEGIDTSALTTHTERATSTSAVLD